MGRGGCLAAPLFRYLLKCMAVRAAPKPTLFDASVTIIFSIQPHPHPLSAQTRLVRPRVQDILISNAIELRGTAASSLHFETIL